jgi:FtsP/CotA-like multicopper oxidase with cupredoxin domain
VDGLENFQTQVSGLPSRVLVMRDANTVGASLPPGSTDPYGKVVPTWDISLNNVPLNYIAGVDMESPVVEMKVGQPELWRVVNAGADSVLDFQIIYDGKPQPLTIVALDGVPTSSQDGTRIGKPIVKSTIPMLPGNRAEFIVTPPGPHVAKAVMQTLTIDTGPAGDSDPSRTLAQIVTSRTGTALPLLPVAKATWPQRFEGLEVAPVTTKRKLYFSEVISNPADPSSPTDFFITVDGAKPVKFAMGLAPAIVTNNGVVEEWTIENHSPELHAFHIHQIHFKLEQLNGQPVTAKDAQFYDDYPIPGWTGSGPYPSIKVKMDFRSPTIVGDFVYHCHILGHEDNGMMAVIRVLPHN